VMVSKVTVKSSKYTSILMGTVQAAIVHGVLDAVCVAQIVAILSPSGPALC
jgi:5,6,7,8-tetrahydromethanopterin hydro-lyase